MESIIASFDDAFLQNVYYLADALKCTPLDIFDFVLKLGMVVSFVLGVLLIVFFECFLRPLAEHVIDRLLNGIVSLFRWLRSRKKNL